MATNEEKLREDALKNAKEAEEKAEREIEEVYESQKDDTVELKAEETANEEAEDAIEDAAEDIETQAKEKVENGDSDYETQFSELKEETDEATDIAAPKKKFPVQVPIIIAAAVVVACLLGFLIYNFVFSTSVVGTWAYDPTSTSDKKSTPDEVDPASLSYFTFTKDNKVEMSSGTVVQYYNYKLSSKDDKQLLEISDDTGYTQTTFEYKVEGIKLFGKQTLSMTVQGADPKDTSATMVLKQSKLPESPLKPYKDFKADEKLIGSWKLTYEGYDYYLEYTFNEDGTMVFNQNNLAKLNCVYTVKDGKLQFKYYYGSQECEQPLEYKVKGNVLTINGEDYIKVGTATPDSQKVAEKATEKTAK